MTEEQITNFIKDNLDPGQRIFVILTTPNDRGITMARATQGFSPEALLGVLFETQLDIMAQIRGYENPTIETYRKVLEPKHKEEP